MSLTKSDLRSKGVIPSQQMYGAQMHKALVPALLIGAPWSLLTSSPLVSPNRRFLGPFSSAVPWSPMTAGPLVSPHRQLLPRQKGKS